MQSGNTHLAPRVTGNWIGADLVFDPKKHKITLDAIQTLEMRRALEDLNHDVTGITRTL